MISPRMKGNSTALAQTTKETASAALMAKKTMRGRVQPPAGRPIGGVFKLTGLDTKPPNVGHNVDVPDKQALACASAPHQPSRRVKLSANHHFRATPTKRNEPESATFVAHPGSLVLHRGPRPLENERRGRLKDSSVRVAVFRGWRRGLARTGLQTCQLVLEHVAQGRALTARLTLEHLNVLGFDALTGAAHAEGHAAIHGVEVLHLGLDLHARGELGARRDFVGRDHALDALDDADERAVFGNAEHERVFHDRAGLVLAEQIRPRIVPELLDAEADLLLVVVDREDDGFDIVALVVQVGRVVDLDRPRQVGLVDHAVHALFDADEHAVIGERAYLAADLVARLVLVREQGPGIGLELLETERDTLGARIDFEHLALHLGAHLEQLGRVLDLLGPAHLADVDQAFHARFEFHERAVVGQAHDLAAHALAERVRLFDVVPRIFLGLLHAQADALGLGVVLEHLDGDLVADLEHFARVIDATPGHVRDVEQAIDTAEVDERAVLGEVLDRARDRHALFEGLQGLLLHLVAFALQEHAPREHDVAALLVELDDLELVGLADQLLEIADRAQIDLRAREECFDAAADGDREAALHALADGAFDDLVALASGGDLVPHLHLVGLLLGQGDQAVVALATLDEHVDLVADLDRERAVGADELALADDAFALPADVYDHGVVVHLHDRAADDLPFTSYLHSCIGFGRFEQRGEAGEGSCVRGCGLKLGHGLKQCLLKWDARPRAPTRVLGCTNRQGLASDALR